MARLGAYRLRRDLLVRVMLPMVAIVALACLLGAYSAMRLIDRVFDGWLIDAARSAAAQVRWEHGRAGVDLPPSAMSVLLYDDVDRTWVGIYQGERLIAGQAGLPRSGAEVAVHSDGEAYDGRLQGQPVRLARVTLAQGGDTPVQVVVAETVLKRARARADIARSYWPLATLVVAAVAAIGLAIRRTVRPLELIARRWATLTHDSLQPVSHDELPRELLPFGNALNGLLQRIRAMLARERQFAANAAHQLRTPLAGLRLGLSRAAQAGSMEQVRPILAELDQATQRTSRLVQQLLSLGRLDPELGHDLPMQPCDLAALVEDVGMSYADQAIAKGLEMALEPPPGPLRVLAHADLLSEAVGNLVDNAIRYTPRGGRIVIDFLCEPPGVRVRDTGPGIPASERQAVMERFYRGPTQDQEGSGLGLAIVDDIAQLHGARLVIDETPGGGTCVTLRFTAPADKPAPGSEIAA